ncbi:MAG: type II toxin-antitoxin system VapC family toxin [Wenzhouxiangellaceae bacterium]
MNLILLDTHAMLWYAFADDRLSMQAKTAIENTQNDVYISVASLWEITIKHQIGKLTLGMDVDTFFQIMTQQTDFKLVSLEPKHLSEYARLPLLHRDPFDRLLISQALVLQASLVSADMNFADYDVDLIW